MPHQLHLAPVTDQPAGQQNWIGENHKVYATARALADSMARAIAEKGGDYTYDPEATVGGCVYGDYLGIPDGISLPPASCAVGHIVRDLGDEDTWRVCTDLGHNTEPVGQLLDDVLDITTSALGALVILQNLQDSGWTWAEAAQTLFALADDDLDRPVLIAIGRKGAAALYGPVTERWEQTIEVLRSQDPTIYGEGPRTLTAREALEAEYRGRLGYGYTIRLQTAA